MFLTSVSPVSRSFTHSLIQQHLARTYLCQAMLQHWVWIQASYFLIPSSLDLTFFLSRVGMSLRVPCLPQRVSWKSNAVMREGALHIQDESQFLFLRRMLLATSWKNPMTSLQISLRAGCLCLPAAAGVNPFPMGVLMNRVTHSGLQDPPATTFFSPRRSGLWSKLRLRGFQVQVPVQETLLQDYGLWLVVFFQAVQ